MTEISEQVSYKIDRVSANIQIELNRLKAQVELFWDKEIETYHRLGLRDGMNILECGSGPGFLTKKILSHCPNVSITGLELDPFLIDIANTEFQELGLERYEFFQGSVLEMGFADDSFDFVIARLLLEHLPEPILAAREIYRVLKPGGKAVIIDNDFEVHLNTYPYIAELNLLYDAYCRARIDEGGNPKIGRELPSILKKSGFLNVDIETIIAHSEVVGDEIFLKSEGSGIPTKLVDDGYLSGDVLDSLTGKWYDMLQDDDHAVFRQLFIVGGEKNIASNDSTILDHEVGARTVISDDDGTEKKSKEELFETAFQGSASQAENEKRLSEIWCKVLGTEHIDINDNFFELGGNSLLAVRIVKDIKKSLTDSISVTRLFQYPTISSLAADLTKDSSAPNLAEAIQDRAKMRRKAIQRRRQQAVNN